MASLTHLAANLQFPAFAVSAWAGEVVLNVSDTTTCVMLPRSEESLVLRTDFSDEAAWEACCAAVRVRSGPFRANVRCVSDRRFEHVEVEELVRQASAEGAPTFVFVVDRQTIADPQRPVLVLDLFDEPGRTFRVIPSALGSVENNLSIGNMDFSDFADGADPDGVFRDWRQGGG